MLFTSFESENFKIFLNKKRNVIFFRFLCSGMFKFYTYNDTYLSVSLIHNLIPYINCTGKYIQKIT